MGAMIGVCGLRIFAWGKFINFAQGRKGESMRQIGGQRRWWRKYGHCPARGILNTIRCGALFQGR